VPVLTADGKGEFLSLPFSYAYSCPALNLNLPFAGASENRIKIKLGKLEIRAVRSTTREAHYFGVDGSSPLIEFGD
jgi:hypothetical protein